MYQKDKIWYGIAMIIQENENKRRIELGKTFRQFRLKAGLTQAKVAIAAEVHVNYYSRIERGQENLSFDVLYAIMKVLKMKSSDLP